MTLTQQLADCQMEEKIFTAGRYDSRTEYATYSNHKLNDDGTYTIKFKARRYQMNLKQVGITIIMMENEFRDFVQKHFPNPSNVQLNNKNFIAFGCDVEHMFTVKPSDLASFHLICGENIPFVDLAAKFAEK